MKSIFPTTYFAPVTAILDHDSRTTGVTAPASTPSPWPSSRPASTKSSKSKRREGVPHSSRPPEPLPRSNSSSKTQFETSAFPSGSVPFHPSSTFGSTVPNMYDSSASLSPSEEDSDSDGGLTARRERGARRRGERQSKASSAPTTPSSSTSSAPRTSKLARERSQGDKRRSAVGGSANKVASPSKSSPPLFSCDRGLGVEIEGLGWDYGAAEKARLLNEAHPTAALISTQSPTYTSDLGSGISTQNSSPEMTVAPSALPPPLPSANPSTAAANPASSSRSRPSRSRPMSTRSRSELEGSKRAPRFRDDQLANHEREMAGPPAVELHPDHIVFSAPATRTSKSPSRRSSIGSTLRTPSLIHSPSSAGHAHDTPPLPTSSTYNPRDHVPQRNKSISSVASTRSQTSSQAFTAAQPTPKANHLASSNAYFPPPPPPKSSRRYESRAAEEELGTTSIPQNIPSPAPRRSPQVSSGPFPGPPPLAASRQRTPPTASSPVFPTSSAAVFPTTARQSPRMPTSQSMPQLFPSATSKAAGPTVPPRRGSTIFPSARPSARSPALLASPTFASPSHRPVAKERAPWEQDGEDELDWMVSAQRKLDPSTSKFSPPRRRSEGDGVRKVFASRRVEQTRSQAEQAAYEREEGGVEGDSGDDDLIDIKDLMVEEELEKHGLPAFDRRTPTKLSTALRSVASPDHSIGRLPHQQHRARLSMSSTGTSEYASAEDDGAEDHSFSNISSPVHRDQPIFPTGSRAPPVVALDPTQLAMLQEQDDQTGLWVLEGISNAAVGENSRRMSAIGEEAESDGKDSGGEESRTPMAGGRLNRKRLSLVGGEGGSGEATPTAASPIRTNTTQQHTTPPRPSTPPLQVAQQFLTPSSVPASPTLSRSPRSPAVLQTPTTPTRPSPQRTASITSRHSLYNFSNSSTVSAQTYKSNASSIGSSRKRGLTKKLGAIFGGSPAQERGEAVEKGISSEHMRAWAAMEEQETLRDEAAKENAGDEMLSQPSTMKKEEVVQFETLLEQFGREEKERLASLKASKWAHVQPIEGQAQASV